MTAKKLPLEGNRPRDKIARLVAEQEAMNAQLSAAIAARAPRSVDWERVQLARGEGFASGLRVALALMGKEG